MALEEADFSMTQHAMDQTARMPGQGPVFGPQPGDDALLVRYFRQAISDPKETKKQGRPIYMEVDYIEISRPGDRNNSIRRPASDRDKSRFPKHWAAYENRTTEEYIEGTLLSDWPALRRSEVEELAYFNVRTVEQLSKIADSNATFMRGIGNLKQRAITYLAACKDSAAGERLNEEITTRDSQITALKQELAEVRALITNVQQPVAPVAPVAPPVVFAEPPIVDVIPPNALVMEPDEPADEPAGNVTDDAPQSNSRRRRKSA